MVICFPHKIKRQTCMYKIFKLVVVHLFIFSIPIQTYWIYFSNRDHNTNIIFHSCTVTENQMCLWKWVKFFPGHHLLIFALFFSLYINLHKTKLKFWGSQSYRSTFPAKILSLKHFSRKEGHSQTSHTKKILFKIK